MSPFLLALFLVGAINVLVGAVVCTMLAYYAIEGRGYGRGYRDATIASTDATIAGMERQFEDVA